MYLYSICILTFKRNELLSSLLDSLYAQEAINKENFEIIIVDNDINKSACDVYLLYERKGDFKIRYFLQPIKNLSISRNLAIHKAYGEYIIFIDDDEIADKNWAMHLIECIEKHNADVVFGKLDLFFDKRVPKYLRHREFYFPPTQNTGDIARFYYTGNVIIRKSALNEIEGPFSIDYGITGGEDTHLFERLNNFGKKLIYCNEAIIWEYVPKERGNLKYLIKKNFRYGNGYIIRKLELYRENKYFIVKLSIKSLIKLPIFILMTVLSFYSRKLLIKNLIKSTATMGEIAAFTGYKIKLYQ